MQRMEMSAAGLALTKRFEGLRTTAYQDCAGVWTIGYGHTGPDVVRGRIVTEEQANALLRQDLAASVICVCREVRVELTQGQFDALVDFCFNVGCGNFARSSLLRYVNRREFGQAAEQFGLWVHAGGKRVAGLVERRAAEASPFCRELKLPIASSSHGPYHL